jgi:hydroxylaminobenzene mutase
MPSATQLSGSTTIIRQAILMCFAGLVWGMFVPAATYPRLALVAHIEAMSNGPMWLGIGAVLQTDFMSVSDTGFLVLKASLVGNWIWLVTEALNGWWGTKDFLSIVSHSWGDFLAKWPTYY